MTDPALLAAAKRQLSITNNVDDTLLGDLIAAAIDQVERDTGLILTQREVIEVVQPGRERRLRAWPIVSVDSVAYRLRDDTEAALTAGFYRADTDRRPAALYLHTGTDWTARCAPLTLTVTAGYASPAAWPATVRQAVMVLVAEFYTNREAGAMSDAAQRSLGWLLRGHKVRTL